MSDLMFLSSDEEEIVDDVPNIVPKKDLSSEKFDEESSQDEFGRDFEFSGILVSLCGLFIFSFTSLCPLTIFYICKKGRRWKRLLLHGYSISFGG
jgi:hypothetical protein